MTGKKTNPSVIGFNIGMNTFHVVSFDAAGVLVVRRKLSRRPLETTLAKPDIQGYPNRTP